MDLGTLVALVAQLNTCVDSGTCFPPISIKHHQNITHIFYNPINRLEILDSVIVHKIPDCYKDMEQSSGPVGTQPTKPSANTDLSSLRERNICRVHKGIQGDCLATQDLPLNVHKSSRKDQSCRAWQCCGEKAHLHIVKNHHDSHMTTFCCFLSYFFFFTHSCRVWAVLCAVFWKMW